MSKVIDALFVESPVGIILAVVLGLLLFFAGMTLVITRVEEHEATMRDKAVAQGCVAFDEHVFCAGKVEGK